MASTTGSYADAHYVMVTALFFSFFGTARLAFFFALALFTTFCVSPYSTEHGLSFPIYGVFLLYISVCASLKRPWLGHGPYTTGDAFAGGGKGGSKIHQGWGRDCRLLLWTALT